MTRRKLRTRLAAIVSAPLLAGTALAGAAVQPANAAVPIIHCGKEDSFQISHHFTRGNLDTAYVEYFRICTNSDNTTRWVDIIKRMFWYRIHGDILNCSILDSFTGVTFNVDYKSPLGEEINPAPVNFKCHASHAHYAYYVATNTQKLHFAFGEHPYVDYRVTGHFKIVSDPSAHFTHEFPSKKKLQ